MNSDGVKSVCAAENAVYVSNFPFIKKSFGKANRT